MFRESCVSLFAFSSRWLLLSTALLCKELMRAHGLTVGSAGPRTVLRAEGAAATLGCRYTPSPSDTGELDIEWSVVNPERTQKDRMLLSYSRGTEFYHSDLAASEGFSFAAGDPSKGDASLSISQLSLAHSATYLCKVKKPPGVDMRKVSLVVLVKPSVPRCWLEGGELLGDAASLRCEAKKGSSPLKYQWWREASAPAPAAAAVQDGASGELSIRRLSPSLAGIYVCEARNAVGAERCRIVLKANKPPSRAAVAVDTAVGSLLFSCLLLVFVGLLCWKMQDRDGREKELSNEIREDVPPPKSRPISRHAGRSIARALEPRRHEASRQTGLELMTGGSQRTPGPAV